MEQIEKLTRQLKDIEDNISAIQKDKAPLNVAFVGEFSSGKSSIINSLIEDEIIPVDDQPMTLAVSRFIHGDNKYIEAVLNDGKIKELSIREYQELKHTNESNLENILNNILGIKDISEIKYINFYYPHPLLSKLNIIDTPGFSTANKRGDDEKTLNTIKELADVLIWVIDAVAGTINEESLKKLQEIRERKKDIKIFIIVNKVDRLTDTNIRKVIESIKNFSEIEEVYPYSSLEKHPKYIEYRDNLLKLLRKIRIKYLYNPFLRKIEYLKEEITKLKETVDLQKKKWKGNKRKRNYSKFFNNFDTLLDKLDINNRLKNIFNTIKNKY